MTKLRINLIRHGEKRLFLPDPGLTEFGESQAKKLAKHLSNKLNLTKKQTINRQIVILSSPKQRTSETAHILAKKLGLTVQIDNFLNIDNQLPNTLANKNKILAHFKEYLEKKEDDSLDILEIFAVTHSQEIKNFWRILGGLEKAIKDVYECGVWTVVLSGEQLNFEWTEGDLNP